MNFLLQCCVCSVWFQLLAGGGNLHTKSFVDVVQAKAFLHLFYNCLNI